MTASELYFLDLFLTADPSHAEAALFQAVGCEGLNAGGTLHPSNDDGDGRMSQLVGRALQFIRDDLRSSTEKILRAESLARSGADAEVPNVPMTGDFTEARLQAALLHLETFERCVVVLRLFARLSFSDLARLLEVRVSSLRFALGRALAHLPKLLHQELESSFASGSSLHVSTAAKASA